MSQRYITNQPNSFVVDIIAQLHENRDSVYLITTADIE